MELLGSWTACRRGSASLCRLLGLHLDRHGVHLVVRMREVLHRGGEHRGDQALAARARAAVGGVRLEQRLAVARVADEDGDLAVVVVAVVAGPPVAGTPVRAAAE